MLWYGSIPGSSRSLIGHLMLINRVQHTTMQKDLGSRANCPDSTWWWKHRVDDFAHGLEMAQTNLWQLLVPSWRERVLNHKAVPDALQFFHYSSWLLPLTSRCCYSDCARERLSRRGHKPRLKNSNTFSVYFPGGTTTRHQVDTSKWLVGVSVPRLW